MKNDEESIEKSIFFREDRKRSKHIEEFLGLTEEDINKRKTEIRRTIPTYPGTGYLLARLKKFKVQPWPFISYLAYWAPDKLRDNLEAYAVYDGNENKACITEQLKEEYISWLVVLDLEKERLNKIK
jgi:hypothetical protein